MIKNKSRIWQQPWGYAESITTVGAIVAVGLLLQIVVGEFNFYLLARPVNYFVIAFLIIISVILGLTATRSQFCRWITSAHMSVTLITTFTIFTILMGLTLQVESESNTLLGFDVMTRNWAFIFVYSLILLILGALVVRRLKIFKWSDYVFYLNHLGLWIFLVASGLGYADMERYIIHVTEGETEWRVYDDNENMKELPIAITLNDFDMDFYPPKLAIIDKETGDVLPKNEPQYFQIDTDTPKGKINGWEIEIDEYIHQAMRNSDSSYREVPMPGATAAARVRASKGGITHSGWICGGNQAQLFMTISLDEKTNLVMTVAEPRAFRSDIEVYTKSEKVFKTILEVNKPLSVDNWMIYQYGYDNNAGRMSSYSSFELVYDPWLRAVYVGIIMMMLGSVVMVWLGKTRKEKNDDVE